MSATYMLVKTPFSPEGLDDPLELDVDPDFKANDYQRLAQKLFPDGVWGGVPNTVSVEFEPTDAGLLVSFLASEPTFGAVRALAAAALAAGAVLMNTETAEIISPSE